MDVSEMSLINQMLQDLDARRSETTAQGQMGPQVRAVEAPRKRSPLILAGVVAGASVLAAAGAGWVWMQPTKSASVNAAAPVVVPAAGQSLAEKRPVAIASVAQATSKAVEAASVSSAASASASAVVQPAGVVDRVVDRVIADHVSFTAGDFPLKLDTRLTVVPPTLAQNAVKPANEPSAVRPARVTQGDQALQPTRTLQGTATKGKSESVQAAAPASTDVAVLSGAELASAVKPSRETTAAQRAESEYRRATLALQQGRAAEALSGFEQAITVDPTHAASRQAIISLLLERGQQDAALRRAKEGIIIDPSQIGIAMILARLHVEKGELKPAIDVLEGSLRHAGDRADYQAFLAAVLQRDGRHKDAVDHYLAAVRQTPQSGVWWMGLGMSLQAQQRNTDALEAYRRAKATNSLSAELMTFVDGRLAQLQR
jgi:MSHA biogenesis protein MshN